MVLSLKTHINSFVELGNILNDLVSQDMDKLESNKKWHSQFTDIMGNITNANQWFTPINVRTMIQAIANSLNPAMLEKWLESYPILKQAGGDKKIGVIVAGNIPLVGFHDFLSVLITDNIFYGKLSRREGGLLRFISEILISIEPEYNNRFQFLDEDLENIDALIATGSNNTSRYFNYNFKNLPALIRKNRNGIAVLDGSETNLQLKQLGKDIFYYFGLGCRNVSKIYVPETYDLEPLIMALKAYAPYLDHKGYQNNYNYQLAIAKMGATKFTDSGFLILQNEPGLSSPIGTIFYQEYKKNTIHNIITYHKDQIQCIVGNDYIQFGMAQEPYLWEYADDIDTINFLTKLK